MIHKISTLAKNLTILAVFVPFFSAQALQIGDGQDVITQDNTGKKEAISVSDESSTVDINITNPLDNQPGMYGSEMITEKMPVAEVHASTIEEIEGGLATAWFGGTEEWGKRRSYMAISKQRRWMV